MTRLSKFPILIWVLTLNLTTDSFILVFYTNLGTYIEFNY